MLLLFSGGVQTYTQKVLATSPIAYWVQGELSGSAAICQVNTAQNGTYTGVTLGQAGIGDGNTCPLFDGANDLNNIDTATLRAAFDGDEGTLMAWFKVSGAGVWSDSTVREIVRFLADSQNYVLIDKGSTNNQLRFIYEAGNVQEQILHVTSASTGWLVAFVTWSASAGANGEVKAYLMDAQVESTATALGTWTGTPSTLLIGASTTVPANVWDGYLAHVAVWDRALILAVIARLARA